MTRCDAISLNVEGPACDPHVRRASNNPASLDFFGDGCRPGQRVLGGGRGQGDRLRSLLACGCDAIGLDRDSQAVAELKDSRLNVLAGSAEQLPFPDSMFDAVICSVVTAAARSRICSIRLVRTARHRHSSMERIG